MPESASTAINIFLRFFGHMRAGIFTLKVSIKQCITLPACTLCTAPPDRSARALSVRLEGRVFRFIGHCAQSTPQHCRPFYDCMLYVTLLATSLSLTLISDLQGSTIIDCSSRLRSSFVPTSIETLCSLFATQSYVSFVFFIITFIAYAPLFALPALLSFTPFLMVLNTFQHHMLLPHT